MSWPKYGAPPLPFQAPETTVRQGWGTITPAIKKLERAIIGRQFQHGGHEVLRWCFDNIQVETDRAGNRLFSKGKARERIDGAVACAIAVSLSQATAKREAQFMIWTYLTMSSWCDCLFWELL
ncbi:terminase TerL endonuclease subunit [Azospirillum oryzae]|uniref:terminase TerL endonuclease subunit n=1 Tax=Azospirillum oryzae TaxID=286727 RepID=UPI001ABF1F99|nr:terminase TerL endonuclease subunit [Azospirillum oryzae]